MASVSHICEYVRSNSLCSILAKVLTWHDGKFAECEKCKYNTKHMKIPKVKGEYSDEHQ